MASSFSLDSICEYLLKEGGKVEYYKLIKNFKSCLADPNNQETRILFKDYVNTVAFVSQESNTKYLNIRPNYAQKSINTCHHIDTIDSHADLIKNGTSNQVKRNSLPDQDSQPPLRRRSLNSSNTSTSNYDLNNHQKYNFDPVSDLKENDLDKAILKNSNTHGLAFKSPGRVKEHAQKLNKIFMDGETKVPMPNTVNKTLTSAKLRSKEYKEYDLDTCSVHSPFDSLKRRWMISASNCDYNELVALLKQDPSLASFKDFTSTALHWAAKFGAQEIIKLIAGTHGVSTNIKSGGFTPLHLAAMYNHTHIMELLAKVYGADPSISDHSGKLAEQYLKPAMSGDLNSLDVHNQSNNFGSLGSLNKLHLGSHLSQPKSQDKSRCESSTFIRIGSLNNKVRKTAAAITRIKGWGSSESVSDLNSMPPPKQSSSKKKKGKKFSSTPPLDNLSIGKASRGHSMFIDKYILNRSFRPT